MTGTLTAGTLLPQLYSSQTDLPPHSGLTLFCDFDGPIIDVSNRYYSTYQLGLADTQAIYQTQGTTLPIQVLSKQQFWQMKQDRVPDMEIAPRSGLRQEQIEVFLQRVCQIVNQPALLHQDHLQPGVRWAIAWLRSHNVRLVVLTLRCQRQVHQVLQEYGLTHLFTGICGTHDQDAAYHNYADLKTQMLRQLLTEPTFQGLSAANAWVIGDTEADILTGQALGLQTIALTCGIRSRFYLQQFNPTQMFGDLLSAAQFLLGDPIREETATQAIHLCQPCGS